jgi:predicted RNA binding protein YcfA (HicA-like mRNA interferase family)
MTKRKKRLEKLRRNPKNVRTDILDAILLEFGFVRGKTKGSHITYRHPSGSRITIAPHGAIAPEYAVRTAIEAIDQLTVEEAVDEQMKSSDEQSMEEDDDNN